VLDFPTGIDELFEKKSRLGSAQFEPMPQKHQN
jgi:hypothetical protein